MGTVAAVATIIGAVASGAAAIVNNRRQRKIAREQQRQNEVRNRIERFNQARRIRQSIAQQRVQQAEAEQAAFQFGVAGGTNVQQAVGAQTTDLSSAIGASQVGTGANELITASQNRVSSIQSQSNPFSTIASISGGFTDEQQNRAVAETIGI